ncbi:BTAD domain-containing putative transcriptional regulator [Kitasatospora sp. MMS16-BH015]|uniref:AfsR/SARP family transcriptional regulator n=1 Tax=Kitasatospora sp. MMS16-BH015 TaxID=2018025 RepID=UPI002739AF42|nr:BTAD domain-containing putative transcriptional regulator [Kitasatospora sp. MMS16-BH015]
MLGQMCAYRGDLPLAVGSPQQQAMLAVLLLRSGRAASIQELVDAVWGEEPPDSAAAAVRTYAWRWRRELAETKTEPQTLLSAGDGYRLALPAANVDALRAEQLAGEAARIRAVEGPAAARRAVGLALDLWRGEPLAGIPGPYAEQQRRRLDELRLALLEESFDLDLQLGREQLAIPELGALIAAHPLRESTHGLYMRALYAAGRQADALAVYHRLRHRLTEELGVEPGPELRGLHQRILVTDESLTPSRARAELAAPARAGQASPVEPRGGPAPDSAALAEPEAAADPLGPPVPAQLPGTTADFTGREAVLCRLVETLTSTDSELPMVAAVAGMGGVGKTALALRAAHRVRHGFPGGQLYADLRGSEHQPADPGMVLASFLAALGVGESALPEHLEDRSRLFRSLVDGRRMLVVLDNARDAAHIRPLLPGSACCAVLVTSRARLLDLPVSSQVDLPVFEATEALALLARIAGPERVDADPAAALALVRNCGLLPLAVRIVAARLASRPSWTVASLTARLADERRRFAELRAGELDVSVVFQLGYRQLTDDQARAFRRVAAVCGPDIGLASAAAAVGGDEQTVEDLLESLVDAALLEAPAFGRYAFHDLVRAFVRQQADAVERAEALHRLLDFLLATATAAFEQVVPGDPVGGTLGPARSAGLRFTEARSARAWVAAESPGVFHAVLTEAWEAQGRPAEAEALHGENLSLAADLLIAVSAFGSDLQREQLARAALAVAEAAQARGDRRSAGRARFLCGNLAVQNTHLDEAEEHTQAAVAYCRQAGDRVILGQSLNDLGLIAQFQHRYDAAVRHYDEAIALARELGQRSGELVTTVNAALARVRSGRAEDAVRDCERALPALRVVADHHGVAYALYVRALARHELARYDEAVGDFTECLSLCRTMELNGREAQARYRLADTLRVMGHPAEAVAQAQRALARCAEARAERDQGHALVVLGRALHDLGQRTEALDRLAEAGEIFLRLGLPDVGQVADLLEQLSR